MRIPFISILIFVSFLLTGVSHAGEWLPDGKPNRLGFDPERLERITAVMQSHVDDRRISGAVMAVSRDGRLVYRNAVGYADLETQSPMREDSIFRIYSMSKPITSTAIMMLVEQGRLRLTDPVSKFIPAFENMKVYVSGAADDMVVAAQKPAMTIRHLLTHTSGIPYQGGPTPAHQAYRGLSTGGIRTLESFVAELATKPLVFQPGTRWMYGMSTDVLGYVVEVVADQPFGDFLKDNITDPLGMDDTSFVLAGSQSSRFTTAYEAVNEGLALSSNLGADTYSNPGRMQSGGGGLISTAADYLRFSQMLLNGGELEGVRILSPRSIELMSRNHLTEDQAFADGLGFGLGFAVVMDPGVRGTVQSEGSFSWAGAADTHFWIDPTKQLIGIVMTQRFQAGNNLRDDMRTMTYQALIE